MQVLVPQETFLRPIESLTWVWWARMTRSSPSSCHGPLRGETSTREKVIADSIWKWFCAYFCFVILSVYRVTNISNCFFSKALFKLEKLLGTILCVHVTAINIEQEPVSQSSYFVLSLVLVPSRLDWVSFSHQFEMCVVCTLCAKSRDLNPICRRQ